MVRCDFNVPLKDGVITDENRLNGALPTIKYLVEKGGKVIAASIWGKIKTATQMVAIILAFLDLKYFGAFIYEELVGYNLVINVLSSSLMLISTIATVFSGIDYLKGSKELFK